MIVHPNVRYWRKADIGLIGGERPLLTQSRHSPFGWASKGRKIEFNQRAGRLVAPIGRICVNSLA